MADPIPRNSRAPVRPPSPARQPPREQAAPRREPAPIAAAVRPRRMRFGRLAIIAAAVMVVSILSRPAPPETQGMKAVSPAQSGSGGTTQSVSAGASSRRAGQEAVSEIASEPLRAVICAQSGPSQFYAAGQRGVVTTRAVMRRDNPTDQNGTAIAEGMTFTVIGESRCAVPETYRAEMLFLHVRLDTPTGDTGWINESGPARDGRIAYNVRAQ